MKENNRKVFVYSITSMGPSFDIYAMLSLLMKEYGELNGCSFIPRQRVKDWCNLNSGFNYYFILLDNPLPTPIHIMGKNSYFTRPFAIIQINEFEVKWKKNSKNKDHILYGSFGSESFISHYAESIINNLNKLNLCKKI